MKLIWSVFLITRIDANSNFTYLLTLYCGYLALNEPHFFFLVSWDSFLVPSGNTLADAVSARTAGAHERTMDSKKGGLFWWSCNEVNISKQPRVALL